MWSVSLGDCCGAIFAPGSWLLYSAFFIAAYGVTRSGVKILPDEAFAGSFSSLIKHVRAWGNIKTCALPTTLTPLSCWLRRNIYSRSLKSHFSNFTEILVLDICTSIHAQRVRNLVTIHYLVSTWKSFCNLTPDFPVAAINYFHSQSMYTYNWQVWFSDERLITIYCIPRLYHVCGHVESQYIYA